MENISVVFEPGERIVSMIEHQGSVYVATERRVYRMVKDSLTDTVKFVPVIFDRLAPA